MVGMDFDDVSEVQQLAHVSIQPSFCVGHLCVELPLRRASSAASSVSAIVLARLLESSRRRAAAALTRMVGKTDLSYLQSAAYSLTIALFRSKHRTREWWKASAVVGLRLFSQRRGKGRSRF